MISEKFMPSYIEFINENFDSNEHSFFYITSQKFQYGLTKDHDVKFFHTDPDFKKLVPLLKQAEKIILHGLWRDKINQILLDNPLFLLKSYWVMWGGDFYSPDTKNKEHHQTIGSLGFLVSYSQGDIDLVRRWYNAKGKAIKCFAYTSNLYRPSNIINKEEPQKNVLVGNSGAENNNHITLLKRLSKFKSELNSIIVPLSYASSSDKEYAKEVIKYGQLTYGEKFQPLVEFLPFDKYLELLKKIDIALFDHNRQQAMGTIVTLLGLGCKVFMKSSVTTWDTIGSHGIKLFDIDNLESDFTCSIDVGHNITKLAEHFSEQALVNQWNSVFNN
jgi:dTDP-N-acetylfucosamine:lipid II N-acetylfucosaminyltransferase